MSRPYLAYNGEDKPHCLFVLPFGCMLDSQCVMIVYKPRRPDDLQPRAFLRKLIKEGKLSLSDDQNIKSRPEKYLVEEQRVASV